MYICSARLPENLRVRVCACLQYTKYSQYTPGLPMETNAHECLESRHNQKIYRE